MPSSLLIVANRYLGPLLFLLSLVVLYRGHNYPGGGFIGGLIAASAVMLLALASGWETLEKQLPIEPLTLLLIGLGTALLSGLIAIGSGSEFLTGRWLPFFELPFLGKVKLGTPLLFDIGVYLTVVGFTVKCAYAIGMEGKT